MEEAGAAGGEEVVVEEKEEGPAGKQELEGRPSGQSEEDAGVAQIPASITQLLRLIQLHADPEAALAAALVAVASTSGGVKRAGAELVGSGGATKRAAVEQAAEGSSPAPPVAKKAATGA